MIGKERRIAFEAMVLQGLFAIMRLIACQDKRSCNEFRCNALNYLDYHGNQSEGSKEHRREKYFKEIIY
mgnify:CR=1 FL=1